MADITIRTDALICKICRGEIVTITVGEFMFHICEGCGRIHNDDIGPKTTIKVN